MRSYGSARVMSRRSAFTGLAAGALGQVVLAQGAPIPSGKTSAQTGTPLADRGFVGAWIATVAVPGRPPSARLLTLMADGTLIRSAPVMPAAGNAPVTFPSAGQGVWRQTSPTTIDLTFVELEADAQGHFRGTATTSARLTLSADGDSLTGPATTTVADPSGKALSRVTGIVRAKRITVQPLASPGAGTPAA